MFDALTGKLQKVFKNLRGMGKISDSNISDSLREVRMALLEADVNFKVVREFIEDIRQKGFSVPFLLMSGNDDSLLETQAKFYGGVFCRKTDCDLIAKIKALNINSSRYTSTILVATIVPLLIGNGVKLSLSLRENIVPLVRYIAEKKVRLLTLILKIIG